MYFYFLQQNYLNLVENSATFLLSTEDEKYPNKDAFINLY